MTVWSEIVALDAPVLLRLRFRLPGMRGTLTYRIGPGSAGTTLVQQEQTFEVAGRLARLRRLMILHLWTARARERLQDIRSHTRSVRTTAPNAPAELMDAPRAAAG